VYLRTLVPNRDRGKWWIVKHGKKEGGKRGEKRSGGMEAAVEFQGLGEKKFIYHRVEGRGCSSTGKEIIGGNLGTGIGNLSGKGGG